ncbi:hypothetical protein BZG36_04617 [Bifiguratus adelaidae]|uniref:GH18 domain-containing protein n=1 Tax=Bifiguratus adelaidae TaxID=1938954 RepID=A0A261XX97_9FUNG|nr:hypothetical protein BZG36_04617 [Bifiguratus adelaidae]
MSRLGLLALTAKWSSVYTTAYWADWTGYSPSSVDFSSITHLQYAFSVIDSSLLPNTPSQLSSMVSAAHAANTKATLSIGGWGGSGYFSPAVATSTSRTNLVNAVVNLVNTYSLDGVDFDWEYPGQAGNCGNQVSSADTANYLLFLQQLRSALGTSKTITAATFTLPFADASGNPSADVSGFANAFDWINIMTYDLNGIWGTTTGVNSPLTGGQGYFPADMSVDKAITQWHSAGMPYNKMTVGTAFYGHYMTSVSSMANNAPSDVWVPVKGGSTALNCNGDGLGGTYTWSQIRSQYLTSDTNAASGWIRQFDPITQTPWLFQSSTNTFLSYDDPQSLQVKVNYAGCMSLKGMMLWEISQDNGELLPVLNRVSQVPAGSNCIGSASSGGSSSTTTTTTTSKSSTSTSPPLQTSSGACSVAAWNSATVYNGGAQVSYGGHLWTAQWWTQGDTPGGSQGVWKDNGPCGASSTASITSTTSSASTTKSTTTTTTSQTSTTTTKTTTSASPTSTSTACTASNQGQYICTASGSSANYQICNNGAWVSGTCGTGTVCIQSGSSITCGYPA